MPSLTLTPAERSARRAEAHHLRPVVMIGSDGLTPAVLKEADATLNAHGLIKIRVFSDERAARDDLLASLCDALGAAPVQHIGKLLVVWRPLPEQEHAPDPQRKSGPRTVKILKFSKSGNHRAQVKKLTILGNERLTAGGIVKRAKPRLQSLKKRTP